MSDEHFEPLSGGCQCGAVRFVLTGDPIITHCCHCRDCQKLSGAAFRINLMIEHERLVLTQGHPLTVDAQGGREVRCSACAGALWGYHRLFGEAILFLPVGLLDRGERLVPEAHYFIRSKHPWITVPPGVPAFATLGDARKPGARERIRAALARHGIAPPKAEGAD